MSISRPTWVEVDLDQLAHNIKEIQKAGVGNRLICVVKADAYGHGLAPVVQTMTHCGVQDFAVAIPQEALDVRKVNPTASVLIMGYTAAEEARELIEADVTITVFTKGEAEKIKEAAKALGKQVKLAIILDTGMSRLGFNLTEEAVEDIADIASWPEVTLTDCFSHFSTADAQDKSYSILQRQRFAQFADALRKRNVFFNHYHMSSSAGLEDFRVASFDSFRPGIIQYGYHSVGADAEWYIPVEPILTWKAKITRLAKVSQGTPVSYGNTWTAEQDSWIATLPVGYADGYRRGLSNRAKVLVHGVPCPQVGRICMDQLMVDVSQVPEVAEMDEVILLGEDQGLKFNADDMAQILDTISYEVLTGIGKRVPRKYLRAGEVIENP